jgi:ribokinase
MIPLQLNEDQFHYKGMIGVGGIGAGKFIALEDNHTLGREESRFGHFLDTRDYCKLHIISHYVHTLLGPSFKTVLVGKVGDDEIGRLITQEMEETGLDVRHVIASPGESTLFSICFTYPDGSGGNLTEIHSACSKVDPEFITQAEIEFDRFAGRAVALAAPEVPLESRKRLLELGTKYKSLRVASFNTGEMMVIQTIGILPLIDVLAINIHEAAAVCGNLTEHTAPSDLVEATIIKLSEQHQDMLISITAGQNGSWSWDGCDLIHHPAYETQVISTAGAGDAHLAGIIVGLVAGLEFSIASELGSLVAALSATSPHTIHPHIDRKSLHDFAQRQVELPGAVEALLVDEVS